MRLSLIAILCVAAVVHQATARPPNRRERHSNGMKYLYQYGYLPKSDMEKGVVRTEREIKKATRMLQKFMGMKMTGHWDSDTMEMMKKPRCGVQDMNMKDEDFVENEISPLKGIAPEEFKLLPGQPRWDKYHITYSYINYTPQLSEREVRETLVQAFKLWSDATLLHFSEQTDPNQEADILIQFGRYYHGDAYPFDEGGEPYRGNVLAHAFPPGQGTGGDVHFDDYEPWTVHTPSGINLLFVAVHEIGHALGLAHSDVAGAIMFPTYGGYDPDLKLHSDDEVIIQYLYGVNRGQPATDAPTTTTTTTTTTTPTPEVPTHGPSNPGDPNGSSGPCETGIDAAALAHVDGEYSQSEIFMFRGPWYWRRSFTSMIENDLIINKWPGLPHDLSHVDAVYQNFHNNLFTFFSGDRFWEFEYTTRHPSTPAYGRPLTDLGLPSDIRKVDAVFTWGHNSRSYIISGSMYWRLSDVTGRVEEDYPRSMDMWQGVPTPVDAAFQLWDGRTYFFRDQDFFVFNDSSMRVEQTVYGAFGRYWLWCQ